MAERLSAKPSINPCLHSPNTLLAAGCLVLTPTAQKDNKIPGNRAVEIPSAASGTSIKAAPPVGRELVKVVASTSPVPLFPAVKMRSAGPFATLDADARSVARDLQVTMDTQANQEWGDYNMVITTVTSR